MRRKNLIAVLTATALVIGCVPSLMADETEGTEEEISVHKEEYLPFTDEVNSEYIYEEISDGTIWIKSYTGKTRELIIPKTINGKKVTILGSDGDSSPSVLAPGNFFTSTDGTDYENTYTVSITIPDTVTHIGAGAFHNGLALTEINVDENNYSYTSKNGILYQGETSIFTYPAGKTDSALIVPDSVTSINDWAFMNSKIKTVTLPDNISIVGCGAFSDCSYLTSINIPTKLTTLNSCVFKNCVSLGNIIIPDNISNIGFKAFSGCSLLTEVTIPQGIQDIKAETFMDCASLATVNLPESLSDIEKKAFYNCSSLVNIVMPDGLRNIKLSAFDNCASLTEINIPSNCLVEGHYYTIDDKNSTTRKNFYIGYFNGCTSLKNINVDIENSFYSSIDGVLYWNYANCNSNGLTLLRYPAGKTQTKFYVPNEVADISHHAFSDCKNLKNIILPDKLEYIHTTAFTGCTSLTSLIIPIETDVYSDTQYDNYYYSGENFEKSSIDTIYGFIGAPIEAFAKKYYNFVGLNSYSLIDEETKIILEGNSENPLNGIVLNVVKESALSTDTSETFNITLKNTSGNSVQPTNKVKVKIPMPSSWNANSCNVYRKEADNKYTNMHASYSDGYMIFTTDHFSEYIITTEKLIPDSITGDVNGNQKVNSEDVILLNRYLAEWGNEIDETAADVNGDGKIDPRDSIALARMLLD